MNSVFSCYMSPPRVISDPRVRDERQRLGPVQRVDHGRHAGAGAGRDARARAAAAAQQ